jgi:flagellar biosynthetic protein FliO
MVIRPKIVRNPINIVLLVVCFVFTGVGYADSSKKTAVNPITKAEDSLPASPGGTDNVLQANAPLRTDKAPGLRSQSEPEVLTPRRDQTNSTGLDKRPLDFPPSFWRPFLSLLAVLALIVLCAWLFRRFFPGSQHGRTNSAIEIIARSAISPKQSVCLVRLGRRLLLVGLSPNHMANLSVVNDPEEIALIMGEMEKQMPNSISKTFDKLFHREARQYDDPLGRTEQSLQDGDTEVLEYEQDEPRQWRHTRHELSSLLSKVKGLARLRP